MIRAIYGAQLTLADPNTQALETYTVMQSALITKYAGLATYKYACAHPAHRSTRWTTVAALAAAHVSEAAGDHVVCRFSDDLMDGGYWGGTVPGTVYGAAVMD